MKPKELLKQKIIPRNHPEQKDKFAVADRILSAIEPQEIHKNALTIRKSFSIPENEAQAFHQIKERALDYRVVLSDSEIIRLGLDLLNKLKNSEFQEKILNIPKMSQGRPKNI